MATASDLFELECSNGRHGQLVRLVQHLDEHGHRVLCGPQSLVHRGEVLRLLSSPGALARTRQQVAATLAGRRQRGGELHLERVDGAVAVFRGGDELVHFAGLPPHDRQILDGAGERDIQCAQPGRGPARRGSRLGEVSRRS